MKLIRKIMIKKIEMENSMAYDSDYGMDTYLAIEFLKKELEEKEKIQNIEIENNKKLVDELSKYVLELKKEIEELKKERKVDFER